MKSVTSWFVRKPTKEKAIIVIFGGWLFIFVLTLATLAVQKFVIHSTSDVVFWIGVGLFFAAIPMKAVVSLIAMSLDNDNKRSLDR